MLNYIAVKVFPPPVYNDKIQLPCLFNNFIDSFFTSTCNGLKVPVNFIAAFGNEFLKGLLALVIFCKAY